MTVSLCIRMVKQTKLLNYKPKGEEYKEKSITRNASCCGYRCKLLRVHRVQQRRR